MLAPKESKTLRKSLKRTMWFLVGIFLFCLLESYLLVLAGVSAVVNGVIIILTATVFYLVFLVICAKIDKKKEKKRLESSSKDPFSH